MRFEQIIDLDKYPISQMDGFVADCKKQFDQSGSLLLADFITSGALENLKTEALEHAHLAYYCQQTHTAYLGAPDPAFASDHPRNRQVSSSKGCITDDQIPEESLLRTIYYHPKFQNFLTQVLGEIALYEYADPLSSINVHYYKEGQELGWHFDNSSFAVTLMIQPPAMGGDFEYISKLRDFDSGDMNFEGVGKVLDGFCDPIRLEIGAGTLALFRGRNSLHHVTRVEGDTNRIQVVLAYNTEPGFALSEQARMTFYGRIE